MKKYLFIITIMILGIGLTGCNYPGQATPTTQVDVLNTVAAQTFQVQQTILAQTEQATEETAATTPTPSATETEVTTSPEPEQPTATATLTPTKTTEVRCDQAAFVSETVKDGADLDPGESFTKTWTLENTGSCTWDADYDVVFVSGDAMDAPASQQLTNGEIEPGETVTIALDLEAPLSAGTHRGEFKLRNADGVLFGIGENDGLFWVEIDVIGTVYDFVNKYCASGVVWTSGAGTLPCPGTSGDNDGWVKKVNAPNMENGTVENEPGLLTHPQKVNDGWIKGTFPEIIITDDVFFKAIIGCNSTENCDVKFKLNYIIDGGTEKTLASWHEIQDGKYNKVEVDLSSLAGEEVQFILLVEANGGWANDEALWVAPRIEP
jgi:hypothetical protein